MSASCRGESIIIIAILLSKTADNKVTLAFNHSRYKNDSKKITLTKVLVTRTVI